MPRAFADRRKERHEQAPLYSPQHFPVVSRHLSNLQALAAVPPRFNGHASPQAGNLILHSSDVLGWLSENIRSLPANPVRRAKLFGVQASR